MKIMIIETVRRNTAHLISWDVDKHSSFDEKYVCRLWWSFDGDPFTCEYKFECEKHALEMQAKIDEFMSNSDIWFNADQVYSSIQNIDNRSNQLNPNHKAS